MQFDVRALSQDHVISQLIIEANDEADALRQVKARGLFVSKITVRKNILAGQARLGSNAGGKLFLLLFSQEILALLKAGLSVVEGLEALLEKEKAEHTRQVLSRLLTGLREGKRFSTVLAAQPELFPPVYVGLIRAAEGTSDLPRSLTRFIEYRQRMDTIRSKVSSAAIYPLILLIVGGGVTLFLLTYVVPRFATVYQGSGRTLPWMSELLIQWGQWAAQHTTLLFSSILLILLSAFLTVRHLLATGGFARLFARMPGIGEKIHVYELSRLYLTLGMLLEGGIPVVTAIDTVLAMVSMNVRASLIKTGDALQSGMRLSDAFEANGLCTPISSRMLRVGERSGELGAMLTQSAAFYDGEINRWIDRFTKTFEPLLMAAIGIIVGVIVVLLYMPIFDLAGSF